MSSLWAFFLFMIETYIGAAIGIALAAGITGVYDGGTIRETVIEAIALGARWPKHVIEAVQGLHHSNCRRS